jgi:hypothetical protein
VVTFPSRAQFETSASIKGLVLALTRLVLPALVTNSKGGGKRDRDTGSEKEKKSELISSVTEKTVTSDLRVPDEVINAIATRILLMKRSEVTQ